ncbi:hypothetical protein HMPREF3293_01667 [Christensenella minuta]|uniref:Uncharacterized protein n=1 Tax=Christensenella minuta TaxID=626937 RepID=A0A136Q435_9FIRM|nr:hypothetical protein HMPREF3293_01667 [Christensenella minuta]
MKTMKNNNWEEMRNNRALIPQVCSYLEIRYPARLDRGRI